jgi:hypothetical protein
MTDAHHRSAEWNASSELRSGDDSGTGNQVASQFLGLFGCRRNAAFGGFDDVPVQRG